MKQILTLVLPVVFLSLAFVQANAARQYTCYENIDLQIGSAFVPRTYRREFYVLTLYQKLAKLELFHNDRMNNKVISVSSEVYQISANTNPRFKLAYLTASLVSNVQNCEKDESQDFYFDADLMSGGHKFPRGTRVGGHMFFIENKDWRLYDCTVFTSL